MKLKSTVLLSALLLSGCLKHRLLDTIHEKHAPVVIHVHCGCEEKTKPKP